MSKRNKLENKANRRADRAARKSAPRGREDIRCAVPYNEAVALLTNPDPKQKLDPAARRYLRRSLGTIITMPQPVVRPFAVRLAEKLASLTLAQVIRRRSQFATRAAGAKYKLAALSPNSKFRVPLRRIQDFNLFALKQAEAELQARKLHALGQLKT